MYREEDKVYVFTNGQLTNEELTILGVRNDEEYFTLENGEGTINAPRTHIMEDDEVDKIAKLLIEKTVWTIEDASEIDELNDYLNGDESDHITVFADATLDGIVQDVAGGFSDIKEFEKWFKEAFSHYSQNGIYKLDGTYYIILVG